VLRTFKKFYCSCIQFLLIMYLSHNNLITAVKIFICLHSVQYLFNNARYVGESFSRFSK
jgi:hypothetical protein